MAKLGSREEVSAVIAARWVGCDSGAYNSCIRAAAWRIDVAAFRGRVRRQIRYTSDYP